MDKPSWIKPVKSLNLHVIMSEEEFQRRLRMFRPTLDVENMMSHGCYGGECADCDEAGCICRCHFTAKKP